MQRIPGGGRVIPYFQDDSATLYHGDALAVARELPDGAADCIVTSPPYFALRDYGVEGQYGLESSPAEYVETMRGLFAELRRVLATDGTLWLNLGDSYSATPPGKSDNAMRSSTLDSKNAGAALRESVRSAGIDRTKFLPQKNLMGIPWQVAFALQADGWILRNAIVWHAPNKMPESVRDRLSQRYEMVFMFSKKPKYWFDLDPIREPIQHPGKSRSIGAGQVDKGVFSKGHTGLLSDGHPGGRNAGDVWEISTTPFSGKISRRSGHPDRDRRGLDGPAYGTQRIASADCPLHVSEDRQDPNASDDGHEGDRSNRIDGSDDRLAQALQDDCVPTDQLHEMSIQAGSSDSIPQQCEPPAIPRSNRSHRKGRAPETSRPCTPSAQSPDSTGHNEEQLVFAEQPSCIGGSNIDADAHRVSSARSPSRNGRKCTCSWINNTESTGHFAVMPVALAERCVQAGCKPGGTVLDPFSGSGTTGLAAAKHGRRYIGIDLNREYLDLSLRTRLQQPGLDYQAVTE